MRIVFFLAIIFSSVSVFAETDTVYFNKDWKPCALADSALYYRLPLIKLSDGRYQVKDYYLSNNQLQMEGTFTDSLSEIKDGFFVFYYNNGQIESKGKYIKAKENGTWYYYSDTTQFPIVISNYNNQGVFDGSVNYYYPNGSLMRNDKYNKFGLWKSGKCYTPDGRDTLYFPDRSYPNVVGQNRAFDKYIWKNKTYKDYYYNKKIYGKVVLNITIDEKGKIADLNVVKGLSDEVNAAAMQILYDGPAWLPKLDNHGKPISATRQIDISFKVKKSS